MELDKSKRLHIKKEIQVRTAPLWQTLGEFTMIFNEVEHLLDFSIKWMIDPWSPDLDYIGIFLKDTTRFNHKREMFYELAKWRIANYEGFRYKKKALQRLEFIYKDLEKASKIRNKILHAKWTFWEFYNPQAMQRLQHDILNDVISLQQIKRWTRDCWASYFDLSDFVDRLRIGEIPGPRP